MLSRLDDDLSVEELLDVASLPRTQALRAVVRLLDEGLVQLRGRS
jgi:DNA-binding IclR family transcriptional regulator